MPLRWKFWKKDDPGDDIEKYSIEPIAKKKIKKSGWLNFLTAGGSVAAGLAALALGDPTAGVASASVIGAVLSLVSPTKNLVDNISDKEKDPLEMQLLLELRGIHQVLRTLLVMVVFGILAYCFQIVVELASKQFSLIDENPLVFILVLAIFYFSVVRRSGE
ncbi:hypothetical protein [Franzmannia qiaohouensis]|uniref:Uncharacterized protein n=1 Tax=Franzmannia qiaohouensis TaxID=1329370 RepID=A0ABU1HDW0_9GAMM|nr:hypothetical protein [Halomonas qiaohouensis]MDR5905658.1 hypothetical protein [Halomonas qiaohouensis]